MIEKIQIENFQRWDLLRVRCGSVTTIVGPSDSGKSSFVRAVCWMALNPRGAGDARHGENRIRVRAKVDGRTVRREKTASKNLYAIDKAEYKAVGSDVPEDVADLLNLSSENFQSQLDGPFWLELTPGELARRINAIVDLGAIDESFSRIASELWKARSRAEVAAEREEEAERRLAELEYVPRMVERFERLREIERDAGERRAEASALASLAGRAAAQAEKAAEALDEARGAESAVGAGEKWREADRRAEELGGIVERLRDVEGDAGREIPDVGELDRMRAEAEDSRERVESLKITLSNLKTWVKDVGIWPGEIEVAEREIEELTGGVCPVCGGPIK